MASALVKLYVHLTFHIKWGHRTVGIYEEDLPKLFGYINGVILNIGGIPLAIGGIETHIHILAALPKNMALPDFVRTVKANSSRWLKTLSPKYDWFAWQDGYGAFSVSASMIGKTTDYIRNQKEHHKLISYKDEYKRFLTAYQIDYDEKYEFDDE